MYSSCVEVYGYKLYDIHLIFEGTNSSTTGFLVIFIHRRPDFLLPRIFSTFVKGETWWMLRRCFSHPLTKLVLPPLRTNTKPANTPTKSKKERNIDTLKPTPFFWAAFPSQPFIFFLGCSGESANELRNGQLRGWEVLATSWSFRWPSTILQLGAQMAGDLRDFEVGKKGWSQKSCVFFWVPTTIDIPRWWQLKYFFNVHPYLGKMNPFWRAYFSKGLVQPPTRYS